MYENDSQTEIMTNTEDWMFFGQDVNSFFKVVSFILYDTVYKHLEIRRDIIGRFTSLLYLKDLYDFEYLTAANKPGHPVTELEIHTASEIYDIGINFYNGKIEEEHCINTAKRLTKLDMPY
ncbi:hypothetical protein DMUE_5179 [Dictyocoela muelleri]|nr:hypothetical protein DMUE_5179 [Dictyocoela muelleri]